MKVQGKFDVSLETSDTYAEGIDGANLGRLLIDKVFRGELEGSSKGEMLSVMTKVQGSGGYVAIEQFVGSLQGKTGSFVLQHYGVMADGKDSLILEVVPNSGSGELSSIEGKMAINIDNGQHYYEFDYKLP